MSTHPTTKSTGHSFTSINFLDSPNTNSDHFLTASETGQLSIYSISNNNNRKNRHNNHNNSQYKIVKKLVKNLTSAAEKIVSTSLFGNDRIIALSESKIYYEKTNLHLIQETDESQSQNPNQEQIFLESLDCQDLKDHFNAPITASSNNRYSNKMQIADSYGNICILEKKTGNVKFYYKMRRRWLIFVMWRIVLVFLGLVIWEGV